MNRSLPLALLVLALPAALPAIAGARPSTCRKATITRALEDAGRPTGAGVSQVRCGDLTKDGAKDALFTVLSGGTAGATHFGVLRSTGKLVLFEPGYKVGVARVNDHRFAVQQPFYKRHDANCCPSSFRITPYRWTGSKFKAGRVRKTKRAQVRFYD